MTTLSCNCGYQWQEPEEYIKRYGDAGKTCPTCGKIGVETKPEEPTFYDI